MTSFVVCSQERAPQTTVDDTAALPTNRNSDGSRTNSAPTEKTPTDPLSESQAAYVFMVCCLDDLLSRNKRESFMDNVELKFLPGKIEQFEWSLITFL